MLLPVLMVCNKIPQSLDIWQSQLASRDLQPMTRDTHYRQSQMSDRIFFQLTRISGTATRSPHFRQTHLILDSITSTIIVNSPVLMIYLTNTHVVTCTDGVLHLYCTASPMKMECLICMHSFPHENGMPHTYTWVAIFLCMIWYEAFI